MHRAAGSPLLARVRAAALCFRWFVEIAILGDTLEDLDEPRRVSGGRQTSPARVLRLDLPTIRRTCGAMSPWLTIPGASSTRPWPGGLARACGGVRFRGDGGTCIV